jgi:hypothetical protein
VRLAGGLVAAVAVAVWVGFAPAPVQARSSFSLLQERASAWRQVEPLLRERARPRAGGFDFEPSFELRTGSGYQVRVVAIGSSVAVIVGRGKHDLSAYLARGAATSRRLQASYGSFGTLDMRFHPAAAKPRRQGRRDCHGRIEHPKLPGVWSGKLRFQSEGRRIAVDIHRAPGSIRRRRPVCVPLPGHRRATSSSGPFSSFSLRDAVGAGWHRGLESADVVGFDSHFGTLYLAFAQRALSSVAILHLAVAVAKPGTFTIDSALTHAAISPPAPFHGTGTYTAAPDGSTAWAGDLTVNFPDAPRFPLTGEAFKAEVKRAL